MTQRKLDTKYSRRSGERRMMNEHTLIFAVTDGTVILYVGTEFKTARHRTRIRGGKCVSVWRAGAYLGEMGLNGKWLSSTEVAALAAGRDYRS